MKIDSRHWIRQLISRPSLQPVWMPLLRLCHAGMNYGGGQTVETSGELEALAFAVRVLKAPRPFTLFDVGANNGEYLEQALKILGQSVRAFSFEPQSSSFDTLRVHFADDPRVRLINVALGKEISAVNLFYAAAGQSTASLHGGALSGIARSETVKMTSVDHICREQGVEQIHFLKVDTEGHEMDVLLGAGEMLERGKVSAIQFEFGETFLETGYHFRDIFNLLAPKYTIYRILRKGLFELVRYTHDLEISKLSNFLCIQKQFLS